MTALIDSAPEQALITHLESLVGVANIAYPNIHFVPKLAIAYYGVMFLGVPPDRLGHGSADRHTGIMQVDVYGLSNKGAMDIIGLARAVAVQFDRVTIIDDNGTKLRVIRPPALGPHGQDVDRYKVPVSITYTIIN